MPLITLALLAAALGYAVFASGGVLRAEWNVSLLLIGASALLYVVDAPPQRCITSTRACAAFNRMSCFPLISCFS